MARSHQAEPLDDLPTTNLVAIRLPPPAAVEQVRRCWDEGEAVAVLDPRAPVAVAQAAIARLQPTHLVDGPGRRAQPGGGPVPADVVAVVLTSGTTGEPKAVELTAAGRDAIGRGFATALAIGPADRWLACLPLHHVAGLAILGRSAAAGFPVVTHDGFDLDAVAASPAREATTIVSLVPTTLARLVDAGAPLERFRWIVTGGAPLPPGLRKRAEAIGAGVVDTYGLSETWGGVLLDGMPLPGAEFRVQEQEGSPAATGSRELRGSGERSRAGYPGPQRARPGKEGELLVRGPMVMRGYHNESAATAAAITTDGWFRTGDIGRMTSDNRLLITDRRHEVIISGGVNVSPTAVEAVLADHPGVADMCVAGRPDSQWGERVVAYVVAREPDTPPSLDDLRAFASDRLSAAQLPRELTLIDAVPRTPGGKSMRRALARGERSRRRHPAP